MQTTSIWHAWPIDLRAMIISTHTNHIAHGLGIAFTEIGEDYLKATMPVDYRTHQPAGILHGGASVVLSESLGSVASALAIDTARFIPVGLEVNANHLRPVKTGLVTGICTPIQLGAKVHVWEIKMYNDQGKMNCISRLTVSILEREMFNHRTQ